MHLFFAGNQLLWGQKKIKLYVCCFGRNSFHNLPLMAHSHKAAIICRKTSQKSVVKALSSTEPLPSSGKGKSWNKHQSFFGLLVFFSVRKRLSNAVASTNHLLGVGKVIFQLIKFHGAVVRIGFWQKDLFPFIQSLLNQLIHRQFSW